MYTLCILLRGYKEAGTCSVMVRAALRYTYGRWFDPSTSVQQAFHYFKDGKLATELSWRIAALTCYIGRLPQITV